MSSPARRSRRSGENPRHTPGARAAPAQNAAARAPASRWPGERLNAVQVVEKEFGEACFVLQHAGDKLVNVETAVEGDAAERQRQRNGFRAAQGFDFAAPAEANQQGGGKGL